jgi:hypothetical protein
MAVDLLLEDAESADILFFVCLVRDISVLSLAFIMHVFGAIYSFQGFGCGEACIDRRQYVLDAFFL